MTDDQNSPVNPTEESAGQLSDSPLVAESFFDDPNIGIPATLQGTITPANRSEPAESEEELAQAFFADEDVEPQEVNPHLDQSVNAVVVAHDGMAWLPIVIAALRAQERSVQNIVVVDTGSKDASTDFLLREFPPESIVTMPRTTSFADALAAGVQRVGISDWLWVLHDDSAPKTDALLHLLDAANRSDAAVVGPKVLGWNDRGHLLEIGVSIGLGGRRETGLERGERDQGQHDRDHDVLAVGSAGMLVRRTVWDELNGFDPFLPMFRDDVDFGWRANSAGYRVTIAPNAVLHHAEAATHRRRSADIVAQHPKRADRLNGMRVVLLNCANWQFPILLVTLIVGSLFRSLGFLLGKAVVAARDELIAVEQLLVHFPSLRQARAARMQQRKVSHKELSVLLAPAGAQVRQALDTVAGVIASSGVEPARLGGAPIETGPGQDDAMEGLVDTGTSLVGRLIRRRGVWTTLSMFALALLAGRHLYGAGRLQGGALLPAPGGASQWWAAFAASWHPVSVGSSLPAPPSLVLMATAAMGFLGSASAVVDAIVILAVPAAYLSAFWATRGIIRSPGLRIWAAATYGLLPAVTIAMSQGRIGTLILAMLLPPLVRACLHAVGLGFSPPGSRAAWGAGLLLAIVGAFVPLTWLVAVVLFLVGAFTVLRARDVRQQLVIMAVVPLVLWIPWSFELLAHPQNFFLEAGAPAPGLADAALPVWSFLGFNPGGLGAPWWVITIGVLPAAVIALSRRTARITLLRLWSIGGGLLVAALVVSWLTIHPINSLPVAAWPGPLMVMAAAALLTAAAIGNEGSFRRISATRFSVRQVLAAGLALLAIAAPVASAVVWLHRGVENPVAKVNGTSLPAFVALQSQSSAKPRTLVLQADAQSVAYALVRGSGPQLGDAEVAPLSSKVGSLDAVVSDLAAGRGGVEIQRLANYAVRFVLVNAPVPPQLAQQLDAAPGLTRVGAPNGGALWQVNAISARARFVPRVGGPSVLPANEITADGPVPAKWPGGVIVLAESADAGWKATVNNSALKTVTINGWAQGFVLPAKSQGAIHIRYVAPARGGWLVVAAIATIVVIVLALPARRFTDEGQDA